IDSSPFPLSMAAGELFPALHDDVGVKRIDFHQKGAPSGLLGGDQGRAAATEKIEHVFATARRVLDGAHGQLHRFLSQMNHILGIHFLDVPKIGGIAGSEVVMPGALSPAIECEFKGAHEVFSGQYGMLLVPDDCLAEVKPTVCECSRVVAEVCIPAPYEKA